MTIDFSIAEANERMQALEAGFALPSSWYTDRDFHARERDLVLRKGWHFATHTGHLREPGDQFICEIAGVPVVLVVGTEGDIEGFVNICRHRAHIVVNEPGNRKTMQCMYHGWTYNLDGCLRRAPRAETELEFDKDQFGLVKVQVGVWGPSVWVNVDREAPPFFEWIKGMPEVVESHGIEMSPQMQVIEREWEIDANWKVFLDNAIECYHCPTCHPTLRSVLEMDPSTHVLDVNSRYWISHRIPLRRDLVDANSAGPTGFENPDAKYYYFHWIFPTTYFQYTVEGFDIGTITVKDVDRIVFKHLTFLPADMTPEEVAVREKRIDDDPTVSEDVAICHRVQAAHNAGVAPPGRLLPRSEWLLQHFQRVLIEEVYQTGTQTMGIPPEPLGSTT